MANGLRRLKGLSGVSDSRGVLSVSPQRSLLPQPAPASVPTLSPIAPPAPQAPIQSVQTQGESPYDWAVRSDEEARALHADKQAQLDNVLDYASRNNIPSDAISGFLKEEGLEGLGEYKPDKLLESIMKKGRPPQLVEDEAILEEQAIQEQGFKEEGLRRVEAQARTEGLSPEETQIRLAEAGLGDIEPPPAPTEAEDLATQVSGGQPQQSYPPEMIELAKQRAVEATQGREVGREEAIDIMQTLLDELSAESGQEQF